MLLHPYPRRCYMQSSCLCIRKCQVEEFIYVSLFVNAEYKRINIYAIYRFMLFVWWQYFIHLRCCLLNSSADVEIVTVDCTDMLLWLIFIKSIQLQKHFYFTKRLNSYKETSWRTFVFQRVLNCHKAECVLSQNPFSRLNQWSEMKYLLNIIHWISTFSLFQLFLNIYKF